MANLFELEIVTPRKKAFSGNVESVSCPGEQGRFQVLHNHAPFLSTLAVGLVKIIDEQGAEWRYAVSGGVAQVFHNRMNLLADTAERADQIDVTRAERAQQRAEERLQQRSEEIDEDRAHAALLRAVNRLKIAKHI
ncbi:MAG: F0F1 ATP synthase subunit epsilon [Bacteroidetes bacterium]|nr:F0F1 ATP synthase subunit epsilon [Bacteroidota bacterium]